MHRAQNGDEEGAERSPKRPRSTARRLLRGLALVCLLGAGASIALVVAVDLGWQRERILGVADSLAEARLGVQISAGSAVGRLWEGVELRDVVVGEATDPLLRVDSLRIRWNAVSLLSGEEWIAESIGIEGWSLRLHRSSEGSWLVLDEVLAHLRETGAATAGPEPSSDLPQPDLLVRHIGLGEGTLILIVDRPAADPDAPLTDVEPAPLRAEWRGTGSVHELRIGPHSPLQVLDAHFNAELRETESGVPELDREVSANLALAVAGQRLESLELDLSAPDLHATARASGRFDHLDRMEIEIEASDLAPLGGWIQATRPLSGQLEAHANLAGPVTALAGSLTINARDLSVEAMHVRELDVEIEGPMDPTQLDLETIDARFVIRARGLDAGGLTTGRLPPGDADLDVKGQVSGGIIDIHRAEVALAGLTLDGSGRARRDRVESSDVAFTLDDVDPWIRAYRADLPLKGGLSGEAKLAGPFSGLDGSVVLRSDGLVLGGRALGALDLTLTRELDQPAELVVATESKTGTTLRGQAQIDPIRERVDFKATAEAEAWLALMDAAPSIQAKLSAEGFFQWTRSSPRFAISLRSRDTFIEGHSIGRLDLAVATQQNDLIEISKLGVDGEIGSLSLLEPAIVELDDGVGWSLREAALEIAVDAGDPGFITLHASGSGPTLEQVGGSLRALPVAGANRFMPDQPPLSGRVSGDFAWKQDRHDDWIRGDIEWLDPGIDTLRFDRLAARWNSTPTTIDIELETDLADNSPLSVQGQIKLPYPEATLVEILSPEQLAFRAELDEWDISTLGPLSPRWMRGLTGRVTGSVRVERDSGGPRLSGRASISDGGFTVPLLRHRFAPVVGTLSLEGREISFDSLQIGKPGAGARLVGSISIPEVGSSEIGGSILFEHLPLSRSSAVWIDVLGEVQLSGTLARPVARGELSIENGRIGIPDEDDPIMKEIRIASRDTNGTLSEADVSEQDFRDAADLDVTIRMPDTTRITGQGANLFVEGEARLVKPRFESLRIHGQARVVNGTYRFQGRRFQVRRGTVQFTGDERLDPILDIEAYLRVSTIVAIIEVTGRLSSPIIRLQSEPSMPERDVLAYLFFGRPADEIGAANNSAFDAAAARLAAGVAEQELQDLLGDAMPIDTIEIEADEMGNTSGVGFGKYVGPRLFLRYVHVLGDEPADRVGVEYRINETFSIGSSVSSTGDTGLDLILRHDF